MSETAPASDMLVDNNRTNNAAVGQTIRFHGRHNGQIVIARQHPKAANRTIASAIHASTGKIALPLRKIAPYETQPTSQKFRQASFLFLALFLALFQGIHQHELKMNNHLRLHSAPIA